MKTPQPSMKKNIMIGILIVSVVIIIYILFFKGESSENLLQTSFVNESLSSPADVIIGRDLLALLAELKTTSIDVDFFNSPLFRNLEDISVDIDPQPIGRRNPFAPFSGNNEEEKIEADNNPVNVPAL